MKTADRIVIDRPAECPHCGSTVRRVLRIVRRTLHPQLVHVRLVRRRVVCVDCGSRYTLMTLEKRTGK